MLTNFLCVFTDDESWAFETFDQKYIYGNVLFSIDSFIYYYEIHFSMDTNIELDVTDR